MTEVDAIAALSARMAQAGIRRLLVLSGEDAWSQTLAQYLRQRLGAHALWVGHAMQSAPFCQPSALKTLLGREHCHAFFDARQGFDVSAFAALAGTLVPGSWLVLLTPDFARWPSQPDADSVRWNDAPDPIATPNFIHHFCRTLSADPDVVIWRQNEPFVLPDFPSRAGWRAAGGEPLAEQAQILAALSTMSPGIAVITAGRGRGKSALAGMHLHNLCGSALVTAPTKGATEVLAHFAGERFRFMAPDALLASDAQADWLIVDEAAAIPGPLLANLVRRFPRTLLLTTVQGYEGTGRGFILKFCARFPHLRAFTLGQPVRWASGCPLETLVDAALLFDDALPDTPACGELSIRPVLRRAWQDNPALPMAMYRLLSAAHYRTSPLDLRRMMDADGQLFACALRGEALAGALWLVEEGGLSAALSRAVWAGFRRPRGNLVAQSLAAHGGGLLAATLKGRRISRIAVHPQQQREGTGRQMAARAVAQADGCDYLSVSFGYTQELARFWLRCGFTIVRLGTHREASSGCYSAIALYPLSAAGHTLAAQEQQRMRRDARWLDAWRDERDPAFSMEDDTAVNDDDWLELAGFAFAHRPLTASLASLNRLAAASALPLSALRGSLQRQPESALCQALGLSGRKALLAAVRRDAALALAALDDARAGQLAQQIASYHFS